MFPVVSVLLVIVLAIFSHALSTSQTPSGLVLPHNSTLPTNGTVNALADWPQPPFRVHINGNLYLNIIVLSFWDPPVDKENIKFSIIDIAYEIKTHYTQTAKMTREALFRASDEGVTVEIDFFSHNTRSLTYQQVRKILNELYDLTQQYGARQIVWSNIEIDGVAVCHLSLSFVASPSDIA
ncbi:hypothetical protein ACLMJK_007288 [Lecanora helva]